jgi:hypothetical protein
MKTMRGKPFGSLFITQYLPQAYFTQNPALFIHNTHASMAGQPPEAVERINNYLIPDVCKRSFS